MLLLRGCCAGIELAPHAMRGYCAASRVARHTRSGAPPAHRDCEAAANDCPCSGTSQPVRRGTGHCRIRHPIHNAARHPVPRPVAGREEADVEDARDCVPAGFRIQSIGRRSWVATRLVELALGQPAGVVPNLRARASTNKRSHPGLSGGQPSERPHCRSTAAWEGGSGVPGGREPLPRERGGTEDL